jgi:ABC-2 type transport system permease protein
MTFEIFKQSMAEKTKGALIMAFLIFALVFVLGYSATATKDIAGTENQMDSPFIKAMVGNSTMNMYSFEGLVTMKGFALMGLIVGCYLAFLAASFIAGEIEHRTCDLLLSLPVSRESMVLYRFAVMVPIVALIAIAEYLGVYLSALSIGYDVDMAWFGYMILFMAAVGLAAGALAMLFSALMSDGRNAALASIGVMMAMYLMETLGSTISGLDWIKPLSLFHYQEMNSIMGLHTVNWSSFGILVAAVVVFVALAALAFRRRDIMVA